MVNFLLDALAAWRLTTMLVNEAGPGQVLVRLREWSGIEHDANGEVAVIKNDWTPLFCLLCTSLWVAGLIGLTPPSVRRALALSGMTVLLGKVVK